MKMYPSSARSFAIAAVAVTASACSATVDVAEESERDGTTQAHLSVSRLRQAGDAEASAEAIARFVFVPANMRVERGLELAGVDDTLPAAGTCVTETGQRPSRPLASLSRVELIDAGEVSVQAGSHQATLAPRAFPSVTDLVSGIVYTSVDRSSGPLPAGQSYRIETTGGSVPEFSATTQAPRELDSVTVNGSPMADVDELAIGDPIDLTWTVGSDLVYARLAFNSSGARVTCSFRDSEGVGTIPLDAMPPSITEQPGRLSVGRVRAQRLNTDAFDDGHVRFDFRTETPVKLLP